MTFTYADPSSSDLEAVRYRIQDTDSDRPLLTDEEIEYELTEASDDVLVASLACAEALIARGSHKVTKKIGQMTINYSDLTKQYQTLAASLQAKMQRQNVTITYPSIGSTTDVVDDSANYPQEYMYSDLIAPTWTDDDAE